MESCILGGGEGNKNETGFWVNWGYIAHGVCITQIAFGG